MSPQSKYDSLISKQFYKQTGHSQTLHQNEVALRKTFSVSCEGHFLTLLFPGMSDAFTPSFATSPPSPFDTNLPAITVEDLERLKNALPSLWTSLKLPEDLHVSNPPTLSVQSTLIDNYES